MTHSPPRVLNFGSINIDHVYQVPHLVRPGETLASSHYRSCAGGKGYNQSIALARAGAAVRHAGCVGRDGVFLREHLEQESVDVAALVITEHPTGHALIQVTPEGENAIILHAGANIQTARKELEQAFAGMQPGDHFLCQNETSAVPEALALARERGLTVWFNPAPMTPEVCAYPLEKVDWLIVNETEGAELSGQTKAPSVIAALREKQPHLRLVLTLGARGALCWDGEKLHQVDSPRLQAVDTTAAGDTFIGYFMAGLLAGTSTITALQQACRAAAQSVTRAGASESIPYRKEVFGSVVG